MPERRIVNPGTGMPQSLLIDTFGEYVHATFGHFPYLVGTALYGKEWRDVDLRLMLDDDEYAAWGLGEPTAPHTNLKWVALCLAFSALGKQITGLPIDFQIQQTSWANAAYPGTEHGRSAVGITGRMFASPEELRLPEVEQELEDTKKKLAAASKIALELQAAQAQGSLYVRRESLPPDVVLPQLPIAAPPDQDQLVAELQAKLADAERWRDIHAKRALELEEREGRAKERLFGS